MGWVGGGRAGQGGRASAEERLERLTVYLLLPGQMSSTRLLYR